MKFSDWIKLREDGVAVGGVGSATVATSGSGATESPGGGTESGSTEAPTSTGTTTNDIAKRPSVLGCGFCYPLCNCKNKKNKRRKRKKGKK